MNRLVVVLSLSLAAMLCSAGCEDDPDDLKGVGKDGTGGAAGGKASGSGGTTSSAGTGGTTGSGGTTSSAGAGGS